MKKRFTKFLAGAALSACLAAPGTASAIAFDISWVGASGYTMSGMMSYDDSLIGTGVITAGALDSFMIEGFLSGGSLGTFDLFADAPLLGSDTFNFNFDTTTETFLTGGFSGGAMGQDWGTSTGGTTCSTTGFGYSSGSGSQALCVSGSFVGASSIPVGSSTLAASRKAEVPAPAALGLVALGLIGLGGLGLRRRRAA